MVPEQLLRYITHIWELYRKQSGADKLPPVIPILIYHGRKKWDIGTRLSDVIEDAPTEVRKYIPDYNYLVYDFSGYTDEEIKGGIKLRLFLKLISDIFRDDFDNGLKQVLPLFNELREKKTGMDYIETVVKYILNTGEEMTFEELTERVNNISIEGSDIIMTIAERLIQEGREEGKKQEKIKIVKNMLNIGIEIEKIAKATNLEVEQINIIKEEIKH